MKKSNEHVEFNTIVSENLAGLRLDQALVKLLPDYSRSQLTRWIQAGEITVDGKLTKPKDKIKTGQTIAIWARLIPKQHWEPQALELNVIHEDQSIILLNKEAGLVVHPGAGNPDQTLVNALLYRYPELAQLPRAGIVHRLDKDTSGLLVIARTLPAHTVLVKAIQNRELKREYKALVQGPIIAGGTINAPIGRHPKQRTKMAILETGKPAITHYRISEKFKHHTLLNIVLETGRTHQIRVHLASIQHPIVGDHVYGRQKIPANCTDSLSKALKQYHRQALHAWRLTLKHPTSNDTLTFTANLPEDINNLITLMRNEPK